MNKERLTNREYFEVLKKALESLGDIVVEITAEEARRVRAELRREDQRRIESGEATPEQIQRENSIVPPGAKIQIIDYRNSLK